MGAALYQGTDRVATVQVAAATVAAPAGHWRACGKEVRVQSVLSGTVNLAAQGSAVKAG